MKQIPVSDPFRAACDPALPTLAFALDAATVREKLKHGLGRLSGEGRLHLRAIRVVRHKPGKRCVVEYDVKLKPAEGQDQKLTLIGKVRARRSGNEGWRQLEAIWNAGFTAEAADGICVPEPVGIIADFKMWFQRKVPGKTAAALLAGPDGPKLARRIADAAHKLHQANLPTEKSHTMADELHILAECMGKLTVSRPEWQPRLERLLARAERLGNSFAPVRTCGIHRDFYSAQVIVDGPRLWLIDFDLFCEGDPGLDLGNFIGHVLEAGVREPAAAAELAAAAEAMEARFAERNGEAIRESVRAYTTLTLIRHVYLSTQFPERAHTTEPLLGLCERRLA